MILAFFTITGSGLAVPAYGNLGPTSEIGFDIYMADELVAEGATTDDYQTIITFTDPTTEDRIITVPDSAQTIGTATSIEDGLIVEADINGDEEPTDNDILTYDSTGANFSWQTPAELTLVVTVGNPSDSQVGVWTGDGTLEGAASFTYDGSNLQFTGDLGSTGTKITKGWFTDLEVANDIAGSITGNAETCTFADNDATAEENEILFAAGAAASGDGALEADSDFTYNPSTGTVTATQFVGGGAGITDVTATANYVEHFMDVAAADNDYCHAQMAGSEALQEITTVITSPDVPRNVSVTYGTVGSSTGNVTITGTLANGTTAQTETFAIGAGDETVVGAKAFATITQITIPDTFYATTTIDVGLDNLLGLGNSINAEADIYKVSIDGVDDADAVSGNVDTTNNTLDCGTITANSDYTIRYHP